MLALIAAQMLGVGVFTASGQAAAPLLLVGVDALTADAAQVTYRVVVTNGGSVAAPGVRLTHAIPANTTFRSSEPAPSAPAAKSPPPVPCDNGGTLEGEGTSCEWALADLAPGQAATVLVSLNLSQQDVATFAVAAKMTVTSSSGGTNDDVDDSLIRERIDVNEDTFVRKSDPPDVNHGGCDHYAVEPGVATAFVRPASLPSDATVERLWAASLRANVRATNYSATERGTLGVHRITGGEWSQGTGSCAGSSGGGNDARSGSVPASEPVATSTAEVTGQPQIVEWDVTPDLDTPPGRATHRGWEIIDGGAGVDRYVHFNSSSVAERKTRLFVVYTKPEAPSCIDVDPEGHTGSVAAPHQIRAVLTDGERSAAGDGCNGAPAAGTVVWQVEDDAPDVYVSRVGNEPVTKFVSQGNAGPNGATFITSADGTATIEVSLSDPANPSANSGTNRISARIDGLPDVPEQGEDARCGVTVQCPGEGATEDDVTQTWAVSGAPTSGVGGAAPSTSPTFARPSRRPASERQVTLEASATHTPSGRRVRFSGTITSDDHFCKDAGEPVSIEARLLGEDDASSPYVPIGTAAAAFDGTFGVSLVIDANSELVARLPGNEECADVVSAPVTVLASVNVEAAPGKESVPRGRKVTVSGLVKPGHRGARVTLQRMTGESWRSVAAARLDRVSEFSFVVLVRWEGPREFRVVAHPRDGDHVRGYSETFPLFGE